MAVTFEGYERRIDKINAALAQYDIASLEDAEKLCLDKGINPREIVTDVQSIAFEFMNLGKFTDALKAGKSAEDAIQGAMGHYGQWDNAAKYIDPRTDEETHSVASTFPVHE